MGVLESAGPGNSVGMPIKGIAKDEKVNPGDIIYLEKEGALLPIATFTAMVAVQEHPGVLKAGYCPVVFSRTAKVACKMTKILWKQSKKTGGAKVENPPELLNSRTLRSNSSPPLLVSSNQSRSALPV